MSSASRCPRSMSRRGFLVGTGVGLVAGAPAGYFGWKYAQSANQIPVAATPTPLVRNTAAAMPGPFPGQVIEVQDPRSVDVLHRIDRDAVRLMMDKGMCSLTGADHASDAWRRFFSKDDVIGIKVNPVGHNKSKPTVAGSISSPEVVLEIVRNLKAIGVPGQNIVLFERYAIEFVNAGYADLMHEREMDGVRWYAASASYTEEQLAINGIENPNAFSPELLKHVVGYDPDSFVQMGFASPAHSPRDDRRYRSHLSMVVSRMVNKFITIPVLKDHRSAGVTLSLKNMSHGMNNNVARSHIAKIYVGASDSPGRSITGPNQCNTFIPAAVNQAAIREKATLHIMDGLIAVYEGGPGNWNRTWGTWRHGALFFATDPVAMDHVGWDIIDTKRKELGLHRVGEMGLRQFTPDRRVRMALSPLAANHPIQAMTNTASDRFIRGGGDSESFDRRTPEHVYLAGTIGLGEWEWAKIMHRKFTTRSEGG